MTKFIGYSSSSGGEGGSTVLPGTVVAFSGTFGGPDNKHPIPKGGTEPDLTWAIFEPLRDRFIRGANTANSNIGETGGSLAGRTGEHTLTVNEIPNHNHVMAVHHQGNGGSYCGSTSGASINAYVSTATTGGSQPHSHVGSFPPYYTLAYIEKLPE